MKITFHGHAVLTVELEDGQKLLFDPFINGNAMTDLDADTVDPDWLLITHGHSDHIGDMVPIAKRTDATIISVVEVCKYAIQKGVTKTHGMNLGGGYSFPFGKVHFVQAHHSAGLEEDGKMIYMGTPAGIILEAEGKTIYHAGDTALFGDMALIGEQFDIDVAFLPIGDNFTMGPKDAATAAHLLKAKTVVPVHYNTFPLIKQDPTTFVDLLPAGVGKILAVGESIEY
jgi:L-ascorbate metabolism protein UlaG (beta-lactamase superfamily)